ncbi:saccharopine dehydrogenase family protein [Myxococcota bacterium]
MGRVLIVGAGAVGHVVAHKCALVPEVFSEILLASRTPAKCENIARSVRELRGREITTAQVDADSIDDATRLMREFRPDLVINVALPYQDLSLMEACLRAGVSYLDTANYEPPESAKFEYHWQWAYRKRFQQAGLIALLGSGFDPGVTNVFCAYAKKHWFDEIEYVDILDCNAGDHGHPFATNFNPEINLREITQRGRYWENGQWHETDPLSVSMTFDFPEVGSRQAYLLYHEELESLVLNLPGIKRIRFWMTFSESYLTHLAVLKNVGMTRIDPVQFQGHSIVPLQFLKAVLPDPASLAAGYQGRTCIGCLVEGRRNGHSSRVFIYNVCDHAQCYQELGAQAISYTTGVPAMVGAMMLLTGQWQGAGVFNLEELDPDPFLVALGQHGLPWHAKKWS